MDISEMCKQAYDIASEYNWPEISNLEKSLLVDHKCPEGFGKLVGESISLFATAPPLGGLIQGHKAYQEQREDDRMHAKRLAELRVLVAKINIKNR